LQSRVQTTVSFIEQIASNLNDWSTFRCGGIYVYAGTPDAVQQMQDEWLAVKQTGYEPISSRHCGQGHRRHLGRSYPLRARRNSIPLPTSSIWSSSWQHEVPRSTSTAPCWKLISQPLGCARQQAPGTSTAGEVALAAHSPTQRRLPYRAGPHGAAPRIRSRRVGARRELLRENLLGASQSAVEAGRITSVATPRDCLERLCGLRVEMRIAARG
jgi:hypothetical protein